MDKRALIHYDLKDFHDYLRDESRLSGQADSISFPETTAEVLEILQTCSAGQIPVTIQGARTGITGGAVPSSGHIMNLSRLNRITGLRFDSQTGEFFLTVEPGILLSALQESIREKRLPVDTWPAAAKQAYPRLLASGPYFFSPDPTESSASLGGMAATNASGARSFYYGPVRNHITALRVAFPGGRCARLQRGLQQAAGRRFSIHCEDGSSLSGSLPVIVMPDVKNAAGYYLKENMDLIDLFIGAEGTLGIILELELRLLPCPGEIWGITCFFPAEEVALGFVSSLRKLSKAQPATRLAAIEFFNHQALRLLTAEKAANPAFAGLARIPEGVVTAVYAEYHANNLQDMEVAMEQLIETLQEHHGREENTWIATDAREMEPLSFFRHAVPEVVNLKIDKQKKHFPSLAKLGTDMAIPDARLAQALIMYNQGLREQQLTGVIFGHIGNNHLHVNIIPATPEEYTRGKKLYQQWAARIIRWGGTISAEHGVGKLKNDLLQLMYGERTCREMQQLKLLFDKKNLLNRGNLFANSLLEI